MMDGQVGAIRGALDSAGHTDTAILAYAAKYASALYGPFRDAAECAPQFGIGAGTRWIRPTRARRSTRRARRRRGRDMVMVKPRFAYLDVVRGCATPSTYPSPLTT
jgi:porphobilinogen synthase